MALWIDFAPDNRWLGRDVRTRLGLDLQGGTQVLLKAQDTGVARDVMQTAEQVIDRRVNGLGLSETIVQLSGNDRIIVELPGVTNPEQVSETLRGTGKLEFIANVDGQGFSGADAPAQGSTVRTSGSPTPRLRSTSPTSSTADLSATQALSNTITTGPIYQSITDGKDLNTSQVQPRFGNNQTPGRNPFAVGFAFNADSASRLERFTSQNVGKLMCIVLDNVVNSCATIQSALIGGSGEITTATRAEAERLFTQLKYGALPVALQVESSRTVSATLGQDSVNASLLAGAVGLVIVALFMILYYRLPGVLATVALLIYTALSFALYRLIPITLTLAGIAGFILSIGLAVDANVLIFARLKEELRHGKSLRAAVEAGFSEAWPAIRDSNASTLITSAILFLFGNSFGVSIIKGFALTLGLGIVVSLFTAITVTRTFLRLIVPLRMAQNPWMFELESAPGLEREREALA
ncbi:MAG TPA: protein translocase subunit SecD [Kouleothrix sp.]|uniref:protein translocase subunit SecD n=1 Tax=Kouleothrix sp. TaxID=2779161 RepID=UPI002CEBECD0|nr:protein translocase subunit SecD [Kouleothrix sp.]HRC74314.1 protein translocase subunit SecD [Kouleothrix sp.]